MPFDLGEKINSMEKAGFPFESKFQGQRQFHVSRNVPGQFFGGSGNFDLTIISTDGEFEGFKFISNTKYYTGRVFLGGQYPTLLDFDHFNGPKSGGYFNIQAIMGKLENPFDLRGLAFCQSSYDVNSDGRLDGVYTQFWSQNGEFFFPMNGESSRQRSGRLFSQFVPCDEKYTFELISGTYVQIFSIANKVNPPLYWNLQDMVASDVDWLSIHKLGLITKIS